MNAHDLEAAAALFHEEYRSAQPGPDARERAGQRGRATVKGNRFPLRESQRQEDSCKVTYDGGTPRCRHVRPERGRPCGGPGPGAVLAVSHDGTLAAVVNGCGPVVIGDEFNYTGLPDPAKWNVYNSPGIRASGHPGNGIRSPSAWAVAGSVATVSHAERTSPTTRIKFFLPGACGGSSFQTRVAQTTDATR